MEGITMPCSELGRGNGADDGEEDARQFVLQVKQTVERCVAQGMNKAQMFRAIREVGLHLGAAFAVYKEIRDQNHSFFQEYYCLIDLKEQRKRLDRLIQAYRGGLRVPETATRLMAIEETDGPVSMMEWPDQQTLQAWLSDGDAHQLAPTAWPQPQQQQTVHFPGMEQVPPNHGQPVANAWPQEPLHLPAWEQMQNYEERPAANAAFQEPAWPPQAFPLPDAQPLPHIHEETAANGGFQGIGWPQQAVQVQAGQLPHGHQQLAASDGGRQGLTWPQHQQVVNLPAGQLRYHDQAVANSFAPPASSAVRLNDAMIDPSWCLSHGGPSSWQGQQAEPLKRWRGASANPSHMRNNGDRGTIN